MDISGDIMITIDMIYCKICDKYLTEFDYKEHKNECKTKVQSEEIGRQVEGTEEVRPETI